MADDFLLKIRGWYNQFTKAEKKVADYILGSPRKVLFMSITELAEACGVGDTSVFRFCKTMNCKGYQEFKMLLSLSLHEGKQGFGQMESDISPVSYTHLGSIDSWNRGSKIPVHRDGPACLHAAVLQKTDFRADPCGCNDKVAGQLFPVFQNQGAYIALGIQAGPGCPG